MSEATTPATPWKYRLLEWFLIVLAVVGCSVASYRTGKEAGWQQGIVEGLTDIHRMCYTTGMSLVLIDDKAIFCGRAS